MFKAFFKAYLYESILTVKTEKEKEAGVELVSHPVTTDFR